MNLIKKGKLKWLILLIIILIIALYIIFAVIILNRSIIVEPYGVDYKQTLSDAKEAINLLSLQDYIELNENIDLFYCKNKPYDMNPKKDGDPIERPLNQDLFSTLYFKGFEQIESMYIDDTEFGLSFVKDRAYPKDYSNRVYKYHLEYGICFIYDKYIDNLPDTERFYLSSTKIIYLENVYDNIYLYIAERNY